jgi:hypothetical protein
MHDKNFQKNISIWNVYIKLKAKAVPLHAMKELGEEEI